MRTAGDRPDPDKPLDGWDRLEPEVADDDTRAEAREDHSTIPLIAGSWGDLALLLAVSAAALVGLKISGHGAPFAAVGWALCLAVVWWAMAAAVLVAVRRATPGMLMAGVRFTRAVPPSRVGAVVAVALLLCATLGIPAAVGPRGWALRSAAGSDITSADEPA
jgi:hypothetical protein